MSQPDAPRLSPSPPDEAARVRDLCEGILAQFQASFREIRCAGTERLVKAGVSMSHFHVLGMLTRHDEMTMGQLADLLDISLSNATGLVDRMEERGLIERVRVPDDRRIVLVRISDRGRSTLEEVEVLRRDLMTKVLARMDEAQLRRLSRSLQDVRIAIESLVASEGSDVLTPAHSHEHPAFARGRSHPVTTH